MYTGPCVVKVEIWDIWCGANPLRLLVIHVILSTRSIAIVISIVMSIQISIPEHSLLQVCLNHDDVIAKIDEDRVKHKLQINCAFTRSVWLVLL